MAEQDSSPAVRTPRTSSLRVPTNSAVPLLAAAGQRKNRNKKALTLGSAASKPGTLSGTDVATLLSATSATGITASSSSPSSSRSSSTSYRVTSLTESLSSSSSSSTSSTTTTTNATGQKRATPAPIQVAPRLGIRTSATPSLDSSTPLLPSTPSLSSSSTTASSSSALSSALASLDLELGVEFNLDLRNEDLLVLNELGAGNGGTVERVKHVPTGFIMAKKVVHTSSAPTATRKQILRELQIMHDCASRYIVSFYGAYLLDPHVVMCMEYMDKGSLDSIYRKVGPIPEPILAQIAFAVVQGLHYLYETHKILHRDVKPSNILLNSSGYFKICDFGVSGELINSVADTFVGTSTYMSPERISGDPYTVKSDVWSLGITLVELALGRFPFSADEDSDDDGRDSDDALAVINRYANGMGDVGDDTLGPVRPAAKGESLDQAERRRAARRGEGAEKSRSHIENATSSTSSCSSSVSSSSRPDRRRSSTKSSSRTNGHQMSILELLQYIVNEPAPRLSNPFSPRCTTFVDACLRKEPIGWNIRKQGPIPPNQARPTPKELLNFEWMVDAAQATTDTEAFAHSIP